MWNETKHLCGIQRSEEIQFAHVAEREREKKSKGQKRYGWI